jgi:4-diphosphocytidyl-2-C-methyl-D-erythritol kinase
MTIEAIAPAKVNLTLHVTGQRPDGYHLLDSLVAFAGVHDRLWLSDGPDMELEVFGRFADGVPTDKRNLVWRAAELAGWHGRIRLEKRLPHGAGIGGGSADAAAGLRMLGVDAPGLSLGADVPVCMTGRAAIMAGIGGEVQPLPAPLPPLSAVLVNPGIALPTPAVFEALIEKENAPMDVALPVWRSAGELIAWLQDQRNDLEGPAISLAPTIRETLETLRQLDGCLLARMSGSGPTCFGLFPTPEDAGHAAAELTSVHPDWWCVATALS